MISAEDRALFHTAVVGVKRIKTDRHNGGAPKPAPRRRSPAADPYTKTTAPFIPATELPIAGEHLIYKADGVQDRVLRRLRSGSFARQGVLDLHGYTIQEATEQVRLFFARAQQQAGRQPCCVQVIHGKGRKNIGQASVLKRWLNDTLPRNPEVKAFCSAQPQNGGSGAIYVLLR